MDWLERQERRAAEALFGAISATHLIKLRPGFGQVMVPAPGSVLASPVDASWDPEPDYFFHWLRDGAVVMDAVRLQLASARFGQLAAWELEQYVAFSRQLAELDGAARLAGGPLEQGVAEAFRQYVREPDELRGVHGDAARGDVRFNPDATLDISRWSRPQYDGVALRALGLLRCTARRNTPDWSGLIAGDLDCVARNASRSCVDLWEEEEGFHFHTMVVEYAALRQGVLWADAGKTSASLMQDLQGAARARLWAAAADDIWARLCTLRREGGGEDQEPGQEQGWIVSRMAAPGGPPVSAGKLLDASVILGVIHAGLDGGLFSVTDPLVHGTLLRLEAHYAAAFPLNGRRAADCAPHLGRNPADVYFNGGAWPLITLAAAELRYRLALAVVEGQAAPEAIDPRLWFGVRPQAGHGSADRDVDGGAVARSLVRAGDMGLAAVRAVTPEDGAMAEQADRETGAPRSARCLSWSYAALLSAAYARQQVVASLG